MNDELARGHAPLLELFFLQSYHFYLGSIIKLVI